MGEFFVSRKYQRRLIETLANYPWVNYHIVNHDGSVDETNADAVEPVAVTWGVFTTGTRPLATSSKKSTTSISSSISLTTTFLRKTACGSCWRKLREIDRDGNEEKGRDKARQTDRPSYTLFYRIYFVHKLLYVIRFIHTSVHSLLLNITPQSLYNELL